MVSEVTPRFAPVFWMIRCRPSENEMSKMTRTPLLSFSTYSYCSGEIGNTICEKTSLLQTLTRVIVLCGVETTYQNYASYSTFVGKCYGRPTVRAHPISNRSVFLLFVVKDIYFVFSTRFPTVARRHDNAFLAS